MRTNTTEFDALPKMQEGDYYAEIGFLDAAKASWKQMKASGRSTSGNMYKKDVSLKQLEGMKENKLVTDGDYSLIAGKSPKDFEMMEDRYRREKLTDSIQDTAWSNYFKAVDGNNLKNTTYIQNEARGNAAKDHYEAEMELQKVDTFAGTAGMFAGGMGSAMVDPINLALLPAGGPVVRAAGQSIAATAGRAATQEAVLATIAEPIIQISEYNWKDEIGVDYTVKDAAFNGAVSVLGAAAVRGAGSAMMDLTPEGIKALRGVDPDLADEYVDLTRNNISPNVEEHMDNLQRIELGEDVKFSAETPEMYKLTSQPIPKELAPVEPYTIKTVDYDGELSMRVGEDVDGEPVMMTYKELDASADKELEDIAKIRNCLLGGS